MRKRITGLGEADALPPRPSRWRAGLPAFACMLVLGAATTGYGSTTKGPMMRFVPASEFGPVIERVLSPEDPASAFLDLASGEFVTPAGFIDPIDWTQPGLRDWLARTPEAEIMVTVHRGRTLLATPPSTRFQPASPMAWDEGGFWDERALGGGDGGPIRGNEGSVTVWGVNELPATFAFSTARNTAGLLMIVEATDDSRTLWIAYKLIEQDR